MPWRYHRRNFFSHFESILARHGGRPHWAKAHGLRPDDLSLLYPRFNDSVHVLDEVEPTGMFRNKYVQHHIFGRQEKEFGGRIFKPFQLPMPTCAALTANDLLLVPRIRGPV